MAPVPTVSLLDPTGRPHPSPPDHSRAADTGHLGAQRREVISMRTWPPSPLTRRPVERSSRLSSTKNLWRRTRITLSTNLLRSLDRRVHHWSVTRPFSRLTLTEPCNVIHAMFSHVWCRCSNYLLPLLPIPPLPALPSWSMIIHTS